ncbi:MAG TPA: ThiF family adenylyltransferase [Candidatus Sulfotelmatobacter sp.]|nr:ThiF family adenylyltransferase [Candidatus Sulfotelmatobacter sp.]
MDSELAYSRPQKTAVQLGELAEDRHRFLHKRILLTGESGLLALPNGRECFLDSLRLAVRICPNVAVYLSDENDDLRAKARDLADRIAFGKKVEFLQAFPNFNQFDAILSIGAKAHPELPWTTINSNGFVARVTSGVSDISDQCDLSNPIGALAAACLGVGEVFKRIIRLKGERGEMLNGFSFSLRTYVQGTSDCGPSIPETLPHDLLVVGAGAIGNGIVHLISRLPFTGVITLVDRQEYGPENLGTCLLLSPDDLSKPKAAFLASILNERKVRAHGFCGPFEQYASELQQFPKVVLNGLDNIDVRHEVQRTLWPNVIIDGAIGDFMCQVSWHPWPDDVACLMCLFQQPASRPAEEVQSEATGLSKNRLQQPDSLVNEADVEAAPKEKQPALRSRIGQPVCSVVQEAVAQKISLEQQEKGFEPSVPFVACFSACMVMTEALAYLFGWKTKLEPRFQFDFLRGPAYGLELPQARSKNCVCGRRKNIERLRSAHGFANEPSGG